MRTRLLVMMFLFISLTILAAPGANAQSERLKVVATNSILGDVVRQVAGDKIDLTVLVGPGGDAHTYEPVPADSIALSKARILFENGLGFEVWLDNLYQASGSKAVRVVVSQGIIPDTISTGADAGQIDPHIWQNIYNFVRVTEVVRDTLSSADPANAVTYQLNANAYMTQLLDVDSYIVQQVQTLPADQRKLVTSHNAFGYFASRYGFEVVGTALGSASTEEFDPSAGEIARLIKSIKATGARAVFPENVENADLAKQIAHEAGVIVGPPLCSDALTPPDGPCPTYLQMMRYNIDSIVGALRP